MKRIVVATTLALAGCSAAPGAAEPCADFVIATDEMQRGLLTLDEYRAEVRSIEERLAGTEIRDHAETLLRELTIGDAANQLAAIRAMADPCRAAITAD